MRRIASTAAASRSATAVTVASPGRRAIARACCCDICPAPISPTRSGARSGACFTVVSKSFVFFMGGGGSRLGQILGSSTEVAQCKGDAVQGGSPTTYLGVPKLVTQLQLRGYGEL